MGHGKRKRSRLSGDRRYLVIHGSAAQDLARLDTQDLVPIPQALAPSAGEEQGWLSEDLWALDKEPLVWEVGAHMSAVGQDGEPEGPWQRARGA